MVVSNGRLKQRGIFKQMIEVALARLLYAQPIHLKTGLNYLPGNFSCAEVVLCFFFWVNLSRKLNYHFSFVSEINMRVCV